MAGFSSSTAKNIWKEGQATATQIANVQKSPTFVVGFSRRELVPLKKLFLSGFGAHTHTWIEDGLLGAFQLIKNLYQKDILMAGFLFGQDLPGRILRSCF